jgi:pimeloyl-ACP methyl ester carboxylesterase
MPGNGFEAFSGRWTGAEGNALVWQALPGTEALTVIFAHGGGQSRRSWTRAARCVSAAGYAALVYDQRGHGDSDWSEDGHYSLDIFRDDFLHVLAQWGRPAVVVGASLGGLVAMMAAAEAPPLLRGVVAIDTAPQLDTVEIHRIVDLLAGDAAGGFESPAAAAAHMNRFSPERAVTAEAMAASLRLGADGRYHWPWDVQVVTGERSSVAIKHEARLHVLAAQVQVPYLLIRAGNSKLVSDAAVERLRSCIPQLEVAWLSGADHLVGGADGERAMELVLPFLDRCQQEQRNPCS